MKEAVVDYDLLVHADPKELVKLVREAIEAGGELHGDTRAVLDPNHGTGRATTTFFQAVVKKTPVAG